MEFLPEGYNVERGSMILIERAERMLMVSSISDKEKIRELMEKMSDAEIIELMNQLREYMPRPGFDCTPHTVYEQGIAIKMAVDYDDFQEQRKRK